MNVYLITNTTIGEEQLLGAFISVSNSEVVFLRQDGTLDTVPLKQARLRPGQRPSILQPASSVQH